MATDKSGDNLIWRESASLWLMIGAAAILLAFIYYDGIERMVSIWSTKEEYGYGYIIPLITIFFIWLKKDKLERIEFKGSWLGTLFVMLGIGIYFLGELSTIYVIIEYSLVIVIASLALSVTGWKGFSLLFVPLLLLMFMIPLPQFIYQGLSAQLQLISSDFGVAFIRLLGISVYLEGNVIDLGVYKLQVVEACSGLRYLFPLASLAFIAAYIYKAPFWKRAIIFLSSVPITIFMNGLRIGVIGVLVDKWGTAHAEGFLHYFEGWVIFMACMVILLFEMWLLTKVGKSRGSFSEYFTIDMPEPSPPGAKVETRTLKAPFITSVVMLVAATVLSATNEARVDVIPDRKEFADFEMAAGEWRGKRNTMEEFYVEALKFEDYIISDYVDKHGKTVNFYSAYYASQRKGESAHSPRTCIPGGGWQIKTITQRDLDGITINGVPLRVNRIEILKGDYRQLVYYWFQGRNRILTNEYMVKWFLFWDALTKSRTDGALVRLTAFITPGEKIESAEERLTQFARDVSVNLSDYIPN